MDINKQDPAFSAMQNVKRRFFAFRNGIIADTLRKAGDPHHIIFGLTLPQLKEIADVTGHDAELASALWNNVSTRESRLLAPMIMPADSFSRQTADKWVSEVVSPEEADILCHRLLRHTSYALDLIDVFSDSEKDLERYAALRLMFNLVSVHPEKALQVARNESGRRCALTSAVARSLEDEALFLLEG